MKKLFIYYSFTGNGDELATHFKDAGYEIRKVVEKKKMPKSFFLGMMVGGFRAGMNLKGKLMDYDNDISDYPEVVVGSPIWNGKIPPAINAVLDQTDFNGKKVTFVFYSGSGEGPKAQEKVKKLFEEVAIIFLKEPKKYQLEITKIQDLLTK